MEADRNKREAQEKAPVQLRNEILLPFKGLLQGNHTQMTNFFMVHGQLK